MRVALAVLIAWMAAATAEAAPTVEDPDTTVARRHFQRGAEDYERGDYQAALRAFEAALALKPNPALRYNIARCADRLGLWSRAADEYERYLPNARESERDELRERIRVLRARDGARAPAAAVEAPAVATPPPAAPPSPRIALDRTPSRSDWLGRTAIAVGVLALAGTAVGVGLYVSARNDFGELQRACQLRQCGPPDWASVDRRAAGAYASWAIAGAAAVVDAALLIARQRRRTAPALAVAPTALGVAFAGRF